MTKKNLAINGGRKTLNTKRAHFSWPPINKSVEKAVIKQLHKGISIYDKSGIFQEFEEAYAKYHDRKFGLLCSSGTLAIHSMYTSAGLKQGDEVICPAYTFFATVSPLLFTGAKPILCDCDENGNIDPEEIKKLITKKTKAVVITHMWGMPCQMDKITKICKDNKLLLLEDCSHAHGAKFKGKLVGSFGDISAWSLQGQKNVSGGEGGILTTNNPEYYYRALILGHYNKRCKQEIPKNHPLHKYAITGAGLKYRAHPLAITIAYETFKNLEKYLQVKNRFAKKMINEMSKTKVLIPPKIIKGVEPSWYSLVFQFNKINAGGITIEKFYKAVKAEGLQEVDLPSSTGPLNLLELFKNPKLLFPFYKNKRTGFSYKKGDFPRSEIFFENAFKLPVWATNADKNIVRYYIKGIKKVLRNLKEVQ